MKHVLLLLAASTAVALVAAAQAQTTPSTPANVVVPHNYAMRAVGTGLNFPTSITFRGDDLWITEAGIITPPAVKEIDPHGNVTTVLTSSMLPPGVLLSPLTDIVYHDGWFWLVHAQTAPNGVKVGAISRFQPGDPAGSFHTVISGLPSFGDHPASQIIFRSDRLRDDGRPWRDDSEDRRAYFTVAAPTNSSVVGPDNSWALTYPMLHDFPAVNVALSGIGYTTQVPFPPLDPTATKVTEPFMPFGGGTVPRGTMVTAPSPKMPQDGIIAGSGSVYSFDPDDAHPEWTMRLEGWGFRTPYGIAFDPFHPDLLFVSNNGTDVRTSLVNGTPKIVGSRPVNNDWDDMFVIPLNRRRGDDDKPLFFGWPDYFHNPYTRKPMPVTDPFFCPTGEPSLCPKFAFDDAFRDTLTVQPAFAELEYHSSANMFDFSTTDDFGYKGDIFIAETGSLPPFTGATTLVGYKIVRIDRDSGDVSNFIYHSANTPAALTSATGFDKPIDVRFRGSAMYIVDFGAFLPGTSIAPGTGKIWRVTRNDSNRR